MTTPADRDDEQLFSLLDKYWEGAGGDESPGASPPAGLRACLDALERLRRNCDVASSSSTHDWERKPNSSNSKDSALRDQLPFQIGPYRLLEEIGRGGMGVVFRGRHEALRCDVAIKMIRQHELASESEIRRFQREAQAAARLQHPHIVSVHDAGEWTGLHYLVMQYVPGDDLDSYRRRHKPGFDDISRLMARVARAVEYLHQHGVIHRDLKPQNILVDERGSPHVSDFGLAKVLDSQDAGTTTGTLLGTPAYMAPEQAWGRVETVSERSDIYSLGAILYELLTGRRPFQETNPLDLLLRLRESDPPRPSRLNREIPSELEQICLRCLEKDPRRRYASASDLADDLERYLRDEPLAAQPRELLQRLQRWARREPALVYRLIAFITMAGIVQVSYSLGIGQYATYQAELKVLGLWTCGSFVLQKLLAWERLRRQIRIGWALLDALAFSAALLFAQGPAGLLAIGYAVLIVAAGLWFTQSLVWLMTVLCVGSYLGVIALRDEPGIPPHYPYIVVAVLLVVGGITSYQVSRIRALTRYFEANEEIAPTKSS